MKASDHWLPALAALGAGLILALSAVAVRRVEQLNRAAVAAQMTAHVETLGNLLGVMQHNFLEASRTISSSPELIGLTRDLAAHPEDDQARLRLEEWTRTRLSTFGFDRYSVYDAQLRIVAADDPVFLGARSRQFDFFAQLRAKDFGVGHPFRARRTTTSRSA